MARKDDTAALFMTGGSQAVRLPKEYRFEETAVRIRREGKAVVLEPLAKADWPEGYWEKLGALEPTPDFTVPEPLRRVRSSATVSPLLTSSRAGRVGTPSSTACHGGPPTMPASRSSGRAGTAGAAAAEATPRRSAPR